jgi:hypothetical protein
MYQRNPSDTVTMIHQEIGNLQWRIQREGRHLDQLTAAIERGDKIDSFSAVVLANDMLALRDLADKLEAAWDKLIIRNGEGKPCLDTLYVDSSASSVAAA